MTRDVDIFRIILLWVAKVKNKRKKTKAVLSRG